MRLWFSPSALLLLTLPLTGQAGPGDRGGAKVVYGEDGRMEVWQAPASLQNIAASTAVVVLRPDLQKDLGGLLQLNQATAASTGVYCAELPFLHQPIAGQCTAFLVGPDLMLTAGHCFKEEGSCAESSFVFGYQTDPLTGRAGVDVPARDVYQCKAVVSAIIDPDLQTDYALVQLDRVVEGRAPVAYRREGMPDIGTPVGVVGSPGGLPLKVDMGAHVRAHEGEMFTANLDAFGGNSGSPVVNLDTLEVEGLLVNGEEDYRFDPERSCEAIRRCADDECAGEASLRISYVPELVLGPGMLEAAAAGDSAVVESYLLENWVDYTDRNHASALLLAARGGHTSIVAALLAHQTDVSLVDLEGRGALHYLAGAETAGEASLEILRLLLDANANVNLMDHDGQTPLEIALERGHTALAEALVNAGAVVVLQL